MQKKSRSGVLRDCDDYFMAAAQGCVDAVVELHEEDAAVLNAARDHVETNENATVVHAKDSIPVNETHFGRFHEDGHFAPVLLTVADGNVVCPCRYSVLTMLCCVADVVSIDGECAIASNFAYMTAMKMNL